MNQQEEWRPVAGFLDYLVSSTGRVVSYKGKLPRELKHQFSHNGYPRLSLSVDGQVVQRKIHQLVAAAFIGDCPEGMEVRHLDGVKTNNNLSNLAYGTRSENMRDLVRHGAHNHASKTECRQGHPLVGENVYAWRGRRKCKTCRRAAVRAYTERRMFRAASVSTERAA